METASQNYPSKSEGRNDFLLLAFALSCSFHAIALFYANQNSIRLPVVNFSQNISKQISVKVKVSTPAQKSIAPKVISKKGEKKVAEKKMITQKVQHKQAAIETREVKQNLGVNNLKAIYLSNLRSLINRSKVYPKMAKRLKHQGRLKIELIIDKNGNIVSKKFINKSHSSFLNQAANDIFKTLNNFGKLPAVIADKPLKVIVPIVYELI